MLFWRNLQTQMQLDASLTSETFVFSAPLRYLIKNFLQMNAYVLFIRSLNYIIGDTQADVKTS